MHYEHPELVRYVEEMGMNPDTGRMAFGGVHHEGQVVLDKWAFDPVYLASQRMLSYRTVVAHEIGHHIGPEQLRGVYPAHREFWASSLGSTLPSINRSEMVSLVEHAMWRFPS